MHNHEQTKNIEFDLQKFEEYLSRIIELHANQRITTNREHFFNIYDFLCSDIRWLYIKDRDLFNNAIKDNLITNIKSKTDNQILQAKLIEYAILLGYRSPCKYIQVKNGRCLDDHKTNGYCKFHYELKTNTQNNIYSTINIPLAITTLISDYCM